MVNQLLAFGSQQLDIWIGGALLQPATLGLYGAAKRSLLLAAMPVQMAMMTMLPIVPRLYALERRGELERSVRSAATFAAMASLPALALLILFPEPILRLAFGGSYTGAASTVLVLATGYLVLVVSGNPPYVLTMTGRHKLVVMVNFLSMLVMVLFGVLGAHYFGAPGLAAGSAASFALQNGLLWWFARRELGVWTHLGAPLWAAREQDAANRLSPRCAQALPEA
jgi:O-antigen/teichoic acid export membrane protein